MAGMPEISLMNLMIGQMARFYRVPWRSSTDLGGAKTFDALAGYDSACTLMALQIAGTHYKWHAAGLDEAGMHCSTAKFIVDAEQCAMACRMAEGVHWDDFDEAVAAVTEVGPGGLYLGHPHAFRARRRGRARFDPNGLEYCGAILDEDPAFEESAGTLSTHVSGPGELLTMISSASGTTGMLIISADQRDWLSGRKSTCDGIDRAMSDASNITYNVDRYSASAQ